VVVTLTDSGTVAAGLVLASEILKVPDCAPTTLTVPVTDAPERVELLENERSGAPAGFAGVCTVSSAALVMPFSSALISEQPAASVAMLNVRLDCFVRLENVIDNGTVAIDVWLLES
jgi:hypothetical protein